MKKYNDDELELYFEIQEYFWGKDLEVVLLNHYKESEHEEILKLKDQIIEYYEEIENPNWQQTMINAIEHIKRINNETK